MVRIKKFRADCNIDNDKPPYDDLQFIRARGLKPTNLLRSKIKELRELEEENIPDTKTLKERLYKIRNLLDKYINFINERGLSDEFSKVKEI